MTKPLLKRLTDCLHHAERQSRRLKNIIRAAEARGRAKAYRKALSLITRAA